MNKKRIIGSSIEPCIHNLGIKTFIKLLKSSDSNFSGHDLGMASIEKIIGIIKETKQPGLIVGLSYRLADVGLKEIIERFVKQIHEEKLEPKRSRIKYVFGGTVPGANLIRAMTGQEIEEDLFAQKEQNYDLNKVKEEYKNNSKFKNFFVLIADGNTKREEILEFAETHKTHSQKEEVTAQDLLKRIKQAREQENRAIYRVHIGLATKTLKPTLDDIEKVCKDKVWDIVSIAPDQHAQEHLYHFITGEKNTKKYPVAQGGCPIRSKKDLVKLWKASQCGNFPLERIYSGTDNLIEQGKIFDETIHICFPAVPIFWYNKLDGRGPIAIKEGIKEHQKVIRFWAKRNKPLEINDPHQWQLRESSDNTYVVDHVLCAVVAKKNGIKNYIMQMMFDLPRGISYRNDLAKMKAAYELIRIFEDKDFKIIKEVRAGLSGFPENLYEAKGHLACATLFQLFMEPDIIHIVSFNEAHHEAKAEDITESCKIVRAVERQFKKGKTPDIWKDENIQSRKLELKRDAVYTLLHIALLGGYQGKYKDKINLQNFDEFLRDETECKIVLLDLVDEKNYSNKKCGLISADALDLTLRTGLLQAPVIADVDKRYSMATKCETEIIDGACRTVSFNGEKVNNEIERINKACRYFEEQIKGTKVKYEGETLSRGISEKDVRKLRDKLKIYDFKKKKVLVADFGSTFTKVVMLDTETQKIKFRYVPTVVEDLRISLANGLGILNKNLINDKEKLKYEIEKEIKKYDLRFACSSAKGGLKIVTVSAVKSESGKASELAALKAGGKILNSYNGELSANEAKQIFTEDKPELVLLTGGVDKGGNQEIVIHNAKKIAEYAHLAKEYSSDDGIPIVYAGTQDANEKIGQIFAEKNVMVQITKNIMPEVNKFDIDAAKEAISKLFRQVIIKVKGFDKVQNYFSLGLMPTPTAALWGINLLARGYEEEKGIGPIFALDIGGCTTDVYCNSDENPLFHIVKNEENKRTINLEPNLPLVFRKVEGKFGLSFSAENLILVDRWRKTNWLLDVNGNIYNKTTGEKLSKDEIKDFLEKEDISKSKLIEKINYLKKNPSKEKIEIGRSYIKAFINDEFKKNHSDYAGNDNNILSQFFDSTNKAEPIKIAEYLKYLSQNPGFIPVTKEENTLGALIANETLKAVTKNNCGNIEITETYFLQRGINFFNMPCTILLIGGTIYHECKKNDSNNLRDLKIIIKGILYNSEESLILRPSEKNGKILVDAKYLISIVGGLYGKVDPKGALQIMKKCLKEIRLDS